MLATLASNTAATMSWRAIRFGVNTRSSASNKPPPMSGKWFAMSEALSTFNGQNKHGSVMLKTLNATERQTLREFATHSLRRVRKCPSNLAPLNCAGMIAQGNVRGGSGDMGHGTWGGG